MKTLQELVHSLEQGRAARGVTAGVCLLLAIVLTFVYARSQFHGIPTEFVMQQAVTARQLAAGEGFTTPVNYPQTYAVLRARGVPFREKQPYPELYHAPLYSLVLAAAFAAMPSSKWDHVPVPPDGWWPDYVALGVNLLLLWIAIFLVWRLAARLFDARTAWLAALGTTLSVTLWQETVALTGLPVFMVLTLAVFLVLTGLDERAETTEKFDAALAWRLVVAGVLCGLLFLGEYSAGLVALVLAGFLASRLAGATRWPALGVFAAAGMLTIAPWLVRNVAVVGHPLGLAWQNLALKYGDPTAEPAVQRNLLTKDPPGLEINKLGNKGLTGLELNLKERIWSGGGFLLTAFFVAGLAYQFRHGPANRLRWCGAALLLVLLAVQPFLNSGESPRLPAYYLAPLIMVFGAGFFFVLVDSQPRLTQHWRWATAALLLLQGLPMAHDCMEPRRIHFHYPPYFPNLFVALKNYMHERFVPGTGVSSDVPAGTAWYGGMRVWSKPEKKRDLSAILVEQNIGALLLTPATLDRPFFTELAARADDTIKLTDSGDWGDVYAGLVTRQLPASFPLNLPPQRLSDNMVLLVNPQTLASRGN